MKLDNVDIELLRLLQNDSKKTTKQYADALHLSKTAVYERIRRLERNGVITQYTALVDKVKVGRDFMVLCQIRLVQHTKENVIKFEREVLQLKEVSECFHVGGDYDYILKGIKVTYLKGHKTAYIDDYPEFDNRVVKADSLNPQPWPESKNYNSVKGKWLDIIE